MVAEELVDLLRSGDSRAFDEIYNILSQPLYNYLFKTINNKEIAEELLHETFMLMIKKIDLYVGKKDQNKGFKQWVFRIATNLTIDHFRKEKTFRKNVYNQEEIVGTDVLQSLELEEKERTFQYLINNLSAKQRALLTLKIDQNLSYKEISIICKCSIGIVKQGIFQAREFIRLGFKKMDEERL